MANKKRKVKKRSTIFLIYFLFIFNLFTGPVRAQTTGTEEITPLVENLKAETTDIIADTLLNDNITLYAYTTTLVENETNEILEERTTNSKTFTTDTGFSTRFYADNTFFLSPKDSLWYNVDYATTTKTNFDYWTTVIEDTLSKNNTWFWVNTANAQDTFDPHSSDGNVYRVADSSWNTVHDATTGTAVSDLGCTDYALYTTKNSASSWSLKRNYFNFDTSSLPDTGYDITGVDLYLYFQNGALSNADSVSSVITPYTPISETALGAGDYDGLTFTNCGSIAFANTGSNQYYSIDVATTSCTIDLTGYTSLGITTNLDVNDSAPTGNNTIGFCYSEETGTTKDPYLEITYEAEAVYEEEATTTFPCILDSYNDISIITGCAEEYTGTSTTIANTTKYLFHIPFFVYLTLWLLISFIFGRLVLEVIIQLRK